MAVAKVIYKSSANATPEVWMDATTATAAAADVIAPKTAMLSDGVMTTGTGSGEPTDNEYATGVVPSGELTVSTGIAVQVFYRRNNITKVIHTGGGVAARAFQEATGLQYFIGIGTTYFYDQVFKGCSNLEAVDIGTAYNWKFETENFGQCSKLSVLVIRKNSVVELTGGVNVFISTPFASSGTGGTLYVPQALITDYQAATNWSTIIGYANNQILPIEGSIYETQYADGTSIT